MSEKLGSYSFKADDTVLQHELKEMVLNHGLKTVAAEFGVSCSTISNICRGIGPQNCREYLRMNFSDYFKMPWTELTTLWTEHNAKDYEPIPTAESQAEQAIKWSDFKTMTFDNVLSFSQMMDDIKLIASGEPYLLLQGDALCKFIDLIQEQTRNKKTANCGNS